MPLTAKCTNDMSSIQKMQTQLDSGCTIVVVVVVVEILDVDKMPLIQIPVNGPETKNRLCSCIRSPAVTSDCPVYF
jgi:hypothetical protein